MLMLINLSLSILNHFSPGYIAGVTNPRFEDLHAWDVLFNLENGKVTVAKDMEPAPPLASNPRPAMTRDAFSNGSLASMGSDGTKEESVTAPTASSIRSGRERAGTTTGIETRQDAPDNLFVEEVSGLSKLVDRDH